MSISARLLPEVDYELARTRATLERVPVAQNGFTPHPKSMSLKELAAHVTDCPGYGIAMLTTPGMDLGEGEHPPTNFETQEQMLAGFDASAAKLREALAAAPETAWDESWKLAAGTTVIFDGQRYGAFRTLFLNHMVHHRAQLGVYLRLTGVPVPRVYGPSADEAV